MCWQAGLAGRRVKWVWQVGGLADLVCGFGLIAGRRIYKYSRLVSGFCRRFALWVMQLNGFASWSHKHTINRQQETHPPAMQN